MAIMGRSLVPLLLLSGADAFSLGALSSLRQKRSDARCFFTEAETSSHARGIMSALKRPTNARSSSSACTMTVDPEMESESRIRGNPEALERWVFSVGGTLGPVVLGGESALPSRVQYNKNSSMT